MERLESEGYIETRQGAGSFVRRRGRAAAASRTLASMVTLDTPTLIAVQNQALARGFLLCVYARDQVGYAPAPERAFLERVRTERHAGILACLTPAAPTNDDLLDQMAAEGIRVLHLEPRGPVPPAQNYLLPDYRRAGALAVTTLRRRGFRRLVFAGTTADWPAAKLFRQGFDDALRDHGLAADPGDRYFEFPTGADVMPAAARRLEEYLAAVTPGTAFVCRGTEFAAAITAGLTARGLAPGEDCLAIGIHYVDEFPNSGHRPAIVFDRPAILRQAVELLTGAGWPRIQELAKPRLSEIEKRRT